MAELHELIEKIENPELRAQIAEAAKRALKHKQFGLVFEEHLPECTPLYDIPVRRGIKVSVRNGKANETYTVLKIENGMATCLPKSSKEAVQFAVDELVTTAELGDPIYPYLQHLDEVCNAPDSELWHTLIEADNYHALQLLEYLYAGKVDCIYIDPPYNTGARDWKYNNDYVDGADEYRHSKWLSFMQKRLEIAKRLLNPTDSVLIVTIDEKEYLHLGCLLEEMFPEAEIQMISSVIMPAGSSRAGRFGRADEYIFYCFFGNAVISPWVCDMLREEKSNETKTSVHWNPLMRNGEGSRRSRIPSLFYPIHIDKNTGVYVSVGEPLPADMPVSDYVVPDGCIAIWPIDGAGNELMWRLYPPRLREFIDKGYAKFGKRDEKTGKRSISYLQKGMVEKLESGKIIVTGRTDEGALKLEYANQSFVTRSPVTVWNMSTHNAASCGSAIVKKIIPNRKFAYPKSLYAVEDCIRFVVADKPNALIIDFFAGSGTTLHAVNLLNAEDGGNRRCIMVTNNEISAEERKGFEARGIKQGDPEWEARGIARYVTWPRTVCSIEGHDVNGNPLKGNYIGSDIPMADGFKTNAAFFKLGFLDKTKVSLGMQFKELLSTLWMKAGAIGKCPIIDASVPDMLILPDNKMAILNDENQFGEFAEQLAKHPEIEVVYLVTDYESSFVAMTQALEGKKTYQLYRDYLDNFRINAGRNSR